MYKRPQSGENDEDLLKLQDEFVRNQSNPKFKPAASVQSHSSNLVTQQVSENVSAIDFHLGNTFEDVPTSLPIGNVVERQPTSCRVSAPTLFARSGFPKPQRRSWALYGSTSGSSKRSKTVASTSTNVITANNRTTDILNDVDMENTERMRRMQPEEIAERQREIISTCDPALIAFLKNRRQELQKKSLEQESQRMEETECTINDCSTVESIMNEEKFEKWLHLDVVEAHKLAWMKDGELQAAKCDENYEARFDFNGWLLPYSFDAITEENRALFHHGSEPQRPGYTLQELFQLCRSSVLQQKTLALNTIAAILNTFSFGVYDAVLELPIEQIFFVTRFCSDDNTTAMLFPSLGALRHLITNDVEEACMDCLFAFGLAYTQPNLAVDDIADDRTLNDQQLVESNLCKCFVRSGILQRIRYIMTTIKPSEGRSITHCTDILIRLARDSDYIVCELWKCPELIKCLITHFLPVKSIGSVDWKTPYQSPVVQVLKLCRLLSNRRKEIASELISKHQIHYRIESYLSNESIPSNANGIKLQIECFRILEAFLYHELEVEAGVVSLQPLLMRFLHFHITQSTVDASCLLQTHASSLIILIARIIQRNPSQSHIYTTLLFDNALPMWMKQFQRITAFQCDKSQILASSLHAFAISSHNSQVVSEMLMEFIKSDGFMQATANLCLSSNFLNDYDAHKSSANLLRAECLVWKAKEHVVPVLQSTSALPFVFSVSDAVLAQHDYSLKLLLLNHNNIKFYMDSIKNCKQLNVNGNWYNRVETYLISNLLKLALQVYQSLDTLFIYEMAAKSICALHFDYRSDLQIIFKNIIFNKAFFPNEFLFEQLSIEQSEDELSCIYEMYENVLGLTPTTNDGNRSRFVKLQAKYTLPVDWIFSPIISSYATRNDKERNESRTLCEIIHCLRWIHIYEVHYPRLLQTIDPTAKFCRLLCVFLCTDSLFLNADVQKLMTNQLQHILKEHEAELDFDQEIQGLNNFYDLYIQLLEQYQSVSYGDKIFGQFLMIPLAQRHSNKLRKALWSEYAGVAQILTLKVEELFCEFDSFLSPLETDASLLQCYEMFLQSPRNRNTQSVLCKIAQHHVEHYKSQAAVEQCQETHDNELID